MDLTPELLGTAAVGIIVILGAIGNYLRTRQQPTHVNPIATGIGGGFLDREQMERLVVNTARIAAAVETIADRRQTDMQETLHEIAEQMKKR